MFTQILVYGVLDETIGKEPEANNWRDYLEYNNYKEKDVKIFENLEFLSYFRRHHVL